MCNTRDMRVLTHMSRNGNIVDMPDTASQSHYATYAAKKARVVEALQELHATSKDAAATALTLTDHGGEILLSETIAVEATGAEVRYAIGFGYYLARTRSNGRGI